MKDSEGRLCATKRDIPIIVEKAEGRGGLIPSVVVFNKDGQVVVGEIAKSEFAFDPANVLKGAKRLIGIPFDDGFIRREMRRVSYKIVRGPNGEACVEYKGQKYLPVQIGSYLLNKMKEMTEAHLGKKANKVVLTVPTYFSEDQRNAYKSAAELLGLDVLTVIEEPIATASSCDGRIDEEGPIVVVDMGGTSLDVSVVTLYDGVFKLKATTSDKFLGGENFDNLLIQFLLEELKKSNVDVTENKGALTRIRESAEKLKIELSSSSHATINLPFIDGVHHFSLALTRSKYEDIVSELVDRVKSTLSYWVKDAALDVGKIKTLVVVGGTMNIPIVREKVMDVFERAPFEGVNTNHAVAIGETRFGDKYCRDGNYVCSLTPSLSGNDLGSFFTRFENYLLSTYVVSRYPSFEKLIMQVVKFAKDFYYWCESKVISILRAVIAVITLSYGYGKFAAELAAEPSIKYIKEKYDIFFSTDVESSGNEVQSVENPDSDVDMARSDTCETIEEPEKTIQAGVGFWKSTSIGAIAGGLIGGLLVA